MSDSREDRFIGMMRALAGDPAARALGDDAAVVDFGSETLVITHDMMVEGVHWLPGQDEADIAWKLVATNLSDLAAKGARPVGVLLGYTLGPDDARFAHGLGEALAAFAVPLLGGDTVSAGHGARSHGLTALGRATHRPVPGRNGARAGDRVWLTGPVGAAMLGFEALTRKLAGEAVPDAATQAFRRPVPRLAEGIALAPVAGAMMDLSDGLLIDARRMALASGVTLALQSAAVPFPSDLARADLAAESVAGGRRRAAMAWGDDYELLFTLPSGTAPPCLAHAIGIVQEYCGTSLLLDGAAPQGRLGYRHD